jgi:hypothetical protein
MLNFLTLGKIVTADTQTEAKKLFLNRHRYGIGGIIFEPEFEIPKWTEAEKTKLSDLFCEVDATEIDDTRYSHLPDWEQLNQNITRNMFQLAREFNTTPNPRSLRFVFGKAFDFKPHCDLGAVDGWLHLFIEGDEGLVCANPIGDEPVNLKLTKPYGDNFDCDEFNRLATVDNKIELISLKPGQAIAFDHTMGHMSGRGKNFRIPTFANS